MSSSSSDIANIEDLFCPGSVEDANIMMTEDKVNDCCEKRIAELKQILQEKYKLELESVKSDYELRISRSLCRVCSKNSLTTDEYDQRGQQQCLSSGDYCSEKAEELSLKYSSSDIDRDLELRVYQIKEEVRKDYESELERLREEIVAKELKRKDEEIERTVAQLNEAHKIEKEKLWQRLDELANKEVENSVVRVKNEVHLSQELEEKSKLIEQLKNEKKEVQIKMKKIAEQKQKELEQSKFDLIKAHKKESENMKQAFEIELKTRIETLLEEKSEMEEKFKLQIEKLYNEINRLASQSDSDDFQAMVASSDEGEDKSQWPPELTAVERQIAAKYQQNLAKLVEEHALEMANMKAEYETKMSNFVKEYEIKQAEDMPLTTIATGNENLDKIIRERDSLRCLALTLRQVVQQLAGYLSTCEDELNRSIVGELLKFASPHNGHKVEISALQGSSSESDSEPEVERSLQRKVHFAPDVSTIVSLVEEDCLFDCLESSAEVSVILQSELKGCLERLKDEAAAVLGITQARSRGLPSTVEDRRLSSVTRQLIEEKKAKEEANSKLQQSQETVQKLEKELHDMNKELIKTRDQMIKQKVAEEAEFNERQREKKMSKLCLLQEKARGLLNEKGECPPQWLSLIDELCMEGDSLIEDAVKARDEFQMEVEAADKQLRSTRAFLEEQAAEREQERDEFTREVNRLKDVLRERDRDWNSHKQYASEPPDSSRLETVQSVSCTCLPTVEALEIQVRDMTELVKESEEKKMAAEKELKTAIEKIWVLRDIISDLEVQVSNRAQHEVDLEHRLAEVETELQEQSCRQTDMLSELQMLRGCSGDNALQHELSSLQDELQRQKQNNPATVRQIKSQLKTMARSLEKQIKELEAVNIHVSTASLSSPSEDVSIREQLEALRCTTPEEKARGGGSPPSPLPIEEMSQLTDQLLRYSRAAENVIKKLRDRELEIFMLRGQFEELQAERDVLQGQNDRQLKQLASMNNKVEELRLRSKRDIEANSAPLHQHILELENRIGDLTSQLKESQRKMNKLKQKLDHSEDLVLRQEAELSSLSDHQQQLVEKLSSDLENMRAEKMQLQTIVEKYRNEDSVSFPQLIEVMLAEKNADIDQLQHRVEELTSKQERKSKPRASHVSFADDVSHSQLREGERARDAHYDASSIKPYFSTPLSSEQDGSNRLLPRFVGEDISKIPEPVDPGLNCSPNRAVQLESALSQLKSELEQKTRRLQECEALLEELPVLKQDLTNANQELLTTTRSITEDKHYYENKLKALGQTNQLLQEREAELKKLKKELDQKDEEHVKTTADLKAVHLIMEGLQQKLQEAQTLSETDFVPKSELQKLKQANELQKDKCSTHENTISDLEKKLIAANEALASAKKEVEQLHNLVEELGTHKQHILSDLIESKEKCKSLQEELETALLSSKDNRSKIEKLSFDLENSVKENKYISSSCRELKKEIDQLTKKQKVDLKNAMRRNSEEAAKDKKELNILRAANDELKTNCEELMTKLKSIGNNTDLVKELNHKDDKIQKLETELKKIEESNEFIRQEKSKTEQDLSSKIAELKIQISNLNKNIVSLETESKDSHESMHSREGSNSLTRKYETCKREYEKIRRARREVEKKCLVLKEELAKEKQFSNQLQNQIFEKRTCRLEATRANIVDIKPEGARLAISGSLDSLTDQVQQELNTSARLDQSLLSGLENHNTKTVEVVRSESMPQRLDYLTSRLAEVETSLHVERVVISELRARLVEEHARYLQERTRTDELQREVLSLQTLNDQFEDKFKTVVYQLEEQVNEIKELRQNTQPSDNREKQQLKKLVNDNQKRVEELLQEREFSKNQLLYLREELAKMWAEREVNKESSRSHGHGDQLRGSALESLKLSLDTRSRELLQEQRKCVSLQQMLDQANLNTDRLNKLLAENNKEIKDIRAECEKLRQHLSEEESVRRSLEAKIKAMEVSEKSRLNRRKALEEKLRQHVAETDKAKKDLEKECLNLQLRLKHSDLQLTAHTAESPLSLRLREANLAVERLVGEKEDLIASNSLLKEEKQELHKHVREQSEVIEDLKSRIQALNVKVTDGGMDNLNAMFAAEREAWMKEKETLRLALAQKYAGNTDSFNTFTNSAHILQRYLRAESHRKALVWQKRYLMVSLRGYQEEEKNTIAGLIRLHPIAPLPTVQPSPEHRFKVAVCVVKAISRMQFLVEYRRRSYENTCRLLQRALNGNNGFPRKVENLSDLQSLWRKADTPTLCSSVQPGNISQYLVDFNTIQERIKSTLSTAT